MFKIKMFILLLVFCSFCVQCHPTGLMTSAQGSCSCLAYIKRKLERSDGKEADESYTLQKASKKKKNIPVETDCF